MGFPLDRGTVKNGILTCHWHHARFDLSSGGTFDPFADDVRSFPVSVEDGEVWVDPSPPEPDPIQRWSHRLEDGLEHNIRLVIAKSALGLKFVRRRLPRSSDNRGAVRRDLLRAGLGTGDDHADLRCQHPRTAASRRQNTRSLPGTSGMSLPSAPAGRPGSWWIPCPRAKPGLRSSRTGSEVSSKCGTTRARNAACGPR